MGFQVSNKTGNTKIEEYDVYIYIFYFFNTISIHSLNGCIHI